MKAAEPPKHRVFVGLGSNLGHPLAQLESAIASLRRLPQTQIIAISPWYRSTPLGPAGQPDYINGVAELCTSLEPEPLLDSLQSIELGHHRHRGQRWGPRTLDLDILLFDDIAINTPRLIIPHPEIANRNFVLIPLADLAPDLTLPDGITLKRLLANVPATGIVPLSGGG
jgi:2-amino-4-hydroxy-6-hydroxymethyldihydropteridine diphosphokinase